MRKIHRIVDRVCLLMAFLMLKFVENVKIVQKMFRISVYNLIKCSKNTRDSIAYSLQLCSLNYLFTI